jgi:hypothetical protein
MYRSAPLLFALAIAPLAAAPAPAPKARKAPGYTRGVAGLERVIPVPRADSDSVLDAVTALNRPPQSLLRMDMWIVRPDGGGKPRVLRVDWAAISLRCATDTNYILMAGDQLFLQARLAG